MLVCFILNVAAVVPQSVRAFTQDWKVGVRIPFATDFFRKNSTGYGRWRTCSTKLPRLTRVVAYRAVLMRKLNVGNNYVFASILYFFFIFVNSLYLPLFTCDSYVFSLWRHWIVELDIVNVFTHLDVVYVKFICTKFNCNKSQKCTSNLSKKLKKIIWMLRLHFLCFIRLLVLLYIMDVKYWVFMKAPYVEK